jgi:SRSO17 transposase
VIVAEAAFGDDTDFRDGLTALKRPTCEGIREGTTVWPEGQEPLPPAVRARARTQAVAVASR